MNTPTSGALIGMRHFIDYRVKPAIEGYASSTFLIVLANSLFVRVFSTKALMPAAFANTTFAG